MPIVFTGLVLGVGLSIMAPIFVPTFVPAVGVWPLAYSARRPIRAAQLILAWVFAGLAWMASPFAWGWVATLLALWVSFLATQVYAHRIFVTLYRPARSRTGLADRAPVLAFISGDQAVAYPIEVIVPHHAIHDVVAGQNILVAW